MDLEKSIIQNQ
ncbi:TPA: hypothetical protein N0F65_009539 [Lagenidium giganteum]|uniref:Uncharacterized protein n=1 Tax=Lagenidium giganteum TaxID=4803 RepID=A0AAV2YX79_9STRA|nr:TPA: hypothetical protein N0F65_009539 [Lagenidium giganteum]